MRGDEVNLMERLQSTDFSSFNPLVVAFLYLWHLWFQKRDFNYLSPIYIKNIFSHPLWSRHFGLLRKLSIFTDIYEPFESFENTLLLTLSSLTNKYKIFSMKTHKSFKHVHIFPSFLWSIKRILRFIIKIKFSTRKCGDFIKRFFDKFEMSLFTRHVRSWW